MTEALRELVVCSLEPWDEVWRRNQFFVDILMRRSPALRVLFVEPPSDPLHALGVRALPAVPHLRRVTRDGRLRALRPVKPLPRRLGSLSDKALLGQVLLGIRIMRFTQPILWLNDATYAPLIERTGFPSVYDMTDDWLLAPSPKREINRIRALEQLIFEHAAEIVVCSPGLERSRAGQRPVTLIPNGVDTEHFRRPQPRPADLPHSPVAVYAGSLHESRLDVGLVVELVDLVPDLSVALVGPDSLSEGTRARLRAHGRITLLGPRPYGRIPAYLQHADVLIVPHVVSPFTESLDPIKAYECLASGRPTVATPVAGFRDLGGRVVVAPKDEFAAVVRRTLAGDDGGARDTSLPSWQERAIAFGRVLVRAQESTRRVRSGSSAVREP